MPRPVRGRSLETQWGFEHLTPSGREAIQVDGVLMFRMVWLYLIAEAVAEPFMGLEHPRDPESWAQPEEMGLDVPTHGFASCWALDAIKDLIQEHGFYLWRFDQGPLGHEKRKPTTVMSSIPAPSVGRDTECRTKLCKEEMVLPAHGLLPPGLRGHLVLRAFLNEKWSP